MFCDMDITEFYDTFGAALAMQLKNLCLYFVEDVRYKSYRLTLNIFQVKNTLRGYCTPG